RGFRRCARLPRGRPGRRRRRVRPCRGGGRRRAGGPVVVVRPGAARRGVTGDSLSMPLDAELARRLVGEGVEVDRDPHVGTGLSKEGLADWGELAARQTRRDAPDAVVMFVGANEVFDLPGTGGPIRCCGADWAAAWAFRARSMIETYRQGGRARVYWLTVPAPRDSGRARISRAVNAAIGVAAE